MERLARAVAVVSIMLGACPALAQEIQVTIRGEVVRPGAYVLRNGDRLSLLIGHAGGFTDNAWLPGAALHREFERRRKEPLLRDILSRVERGLLAKPGEEQAKREFLGRLAALLPDNRMPVRLRHPRLLKGSDDDLLLEDGDELLVPPKAGVVTVAGSVRKPGTVAIRAPNADPEELVRAAGGYAEDADHKHAYLLRANTTIVPISRGRIRWNPVESRWEIPAFSEPAPRAEPGDTIVVPGKPLRSSWAREVEDLPRMLMQVHSLTGVRIDPP